MAPILSGLMIAGTVLGAGFLPGEYNRLPTQRNRRRRFMEETMTQDLSGGGSLRLALQEQQGLSEMIDKLSLMGSTLPFDDGTLMGARSAGETGLRAQINQLIGNENSARVAELSVTEASDPYMLAARMGLM